MSGTACVCRRVTFPSAEEANAHPGAAAWPSSPYAPECADHACALWRKFAHQGWLYLSENYLCFYSYLLGVETKLFVELKDIKTLSKEKVAGGLLSNSIRITTVDGREARSPLHDCWCATVGADSQRRARLTVCVCGGGTRAYSTFSSTFSTATRPFSRLSSSPTTPSCVCCPLHRPTPPRPARLSRLRRAS